MKASNRLHIFTITIILLFVSGCSNHKIRHELRAFQRSEVSLSFELERVLDRNIGIESPGSGAVSMVMYYDSTECSQCRINHLSDCLPLYELADSIGTFRIVTIFAPRQEEYDEVMASLMKQDFPYPIYVDFDGSFRKANRCIPEDKRFHSFLLDRDGHPVFVGNPVSSEKMHELFKRALEKACQE